VLIWLVIIELIALGASVYLASFGIWAAKQKNWLGAVGIWVIALTTLTAPLGAYMIHWLGD
jgi:multisubunit Na+/H+ antiporter MnhG subunit